MSAPAGGKHGPLLHLSNPDVFVSKLIMSWKSKRTELEWIKDELIRHPRMDSRVGILEEVTL